MCAANSHPNSFITVPILGNKCDLEEEREVPFEKACNLAKERGVLAALETSAKVMHMNTTEKFDTENEEIKLFSKSFSSFTGKSKCGGSLLDDGQGAAVS